MNQHKPGTIWGMNSILKVIVGAFALAIVTFIGYRIFKEITRRREVSSVVNIEQNANIQAAWDLGNFESIAHTNYLMAPVFSKQSYQQSYYEKGASAVRNYLFVNAIDKTTNWLVETNNYLFLSADKLHWSDNKPDEGTIKWIKYRVVKSDTNADGRLTDKDRWAIAFTDATGKGYTELIQNVEELLGSTLRDENTLIIFYKIDQKRFVSEINLPLRKITETKELPIFLSQ